jgi:hypothetical protein
MASAAYRPDQTQAPYTSWMPFDRDHRLQTDDEWVISDDVAVMGHARPALVAFPQQARTQFKDSYARWLEDSVFDSLPDRMRRHDSYQKIVAMGDRVVPLIAAELRKEPSFLFLALEDITKLNPVSEAALGNLRRTVDEWLTCLRK